MLMSTLLLFPSHYSLLIEATLGGFSSEVQLGFPLAWCEQYALVIAAALVLKTSDLVHRIVSATVNTLRRRRREQAITLLLMCAFFLSASP